MDKRQGEGDKAKGAAKDGPGKMTGGAEPKAEGNAKNAKGVAEKVAGGEKDEPSDRTGRFR